MPRAAAAQGKLEKEDVDVRKGFLLAVALVAFLFPSGAGAVEKKWIGNSGESWNDDTHWNGGSKPTDAELAKFSGAGTPVKIDAAAVAGGLKLDSGFLLDIQAGGSLTLGSANSAVDIELTGGGEAEIRTTDTTKLDFVGTVPQLNLNVPSSARLKLGNTSAPAAVHQSGGSVQLTGTVTAAAGGTVWHVNGGLLHVKKNEAFSGNMTVKVAAGKEVQFVKGADADAGFDFAAGSSIASLDVADATSAVPALKLKALTGDVMLKLINVPAALAPGGVLRVIDCASPIPAVAKISLDPASAAKYEIQRSGDRRSVMIGTRAVASADVVGFTPPTDSLASREYEPGVPFAASFDVTSSAGQALTVTTIPGSSLPAWLGYVVTPKGGVSSDVTVVLSGTPDATVSGDIPLGFRASTATASADMTYTIVKKGSGGTPNPNPNPNPNPRPGQPGPLPRPNPGDPLLPDPNRKSRSGGGGCDAGLAGIVALLALLPLRSRRRK